jgi:hypothetical protein
MTTPKSRAGRRVVQLGSHAVAPLEEQYAASRYQRPECVVFGESILVAWAKGHATRGQRDAVGEIVGELESALNEIASRRVEHPEFFASRELSRLRDEAREALDAE